MRITFRVESVPCLPCLLGTLPIVGTTCGHMRVRSGHSSLQMRFRDGLTVRRRIQVHEAEQVCCACFCNSYRQLQEQALHALHCFVHWVRLSPLCCVLLVTKAWTNKPELVRHVTDCLEES